MIPGEYLLASDSVVANAGRRTTNIEVANVGDRPIQVGSHFHFFEVNGGGIVQFVLDGNRVRFEINLAAAQRLGLKLSSELLKLAIAIRKAS